MANTSLSKITIEKVGEDIVEGVPDLIYAIILFLVGFKISKMIKKYVNDILLKNNVDIGITNFVVYGVYIMSLSALTMTCLYMVGIPTGSVVAVIGAAGFSIGLAFKEILSNLGSGMIILFFKPFNIGDYIQGSGVEGIVSNIQIFSTELKTPDNKTVIIPNFKLTTTNIINFTNQDYRRIDFTYNVAYNTDIELVKNILINIFEEDERISKDPKYIIGINSIVNNSMEIVARPWVKTMDYYDVYFDVMEKVKKEFDKNNVEIPYINIVSNSFSVNKKNNNPTGI